MDFDLRGRHSEKIQRYLPYGGLLFSVVLALVVGSGGAVFVTAVLGFSAAAAGWMAWGAATSQEAALHPVRSSVYYVGLLLLIGMLVFLSPMFGFFAFIGYLHALMLPGRTKFAAIAATAALMATTQMGGVQNITRISVFLYLGLVVVNVFIAGVLSYSGLAEEERGRKRAEMIEALAEANRRLKETLEENAGLHAQLVVQAREAGVLDERQRMAGEIHDTIAQGLTGIVRQLEVAERCDDDADRRRHHIKLARGLAHESLAEARRSVQALRPGQLAEAKLPEAVGELAKTWSLTSGIIARVEVTGQVVPLPPVVEVVLFRSAQEALANIAKHAAASQVGVTLSYTHEVVVLDVVDDGKGFEPGSAAGSGEDGYGLTAMRQRLRQVGGSLTVESVPGDGTAISAVVPALASG